jgi:hypothetical protein
MSTLRINLHIRSDASPRLFEALAKLPPRPRAELLRKLGDLGLQISEGAIPLPKYSTPSRAPSTERPAFDTDSPNENFGDDITSLVGSAF